VATGLTVDSKTWVPLDDRWVKDPGLSMPEGLPDSMRERWAEMTKRIADDDRTQTWHLDGTPWHDAPTPRRWHKCATQTYGIVNWFDTVHRCACGAISDNGRDWLERNRRENR